MQLLHRFPNYGTFKALFNYFKDAAATKRNCQGKETANKGHFFDTFQIKPGPDSKLTLPRGISYCYDAIESGIAFKGFGL